MKDIKDKSIDMILCDLPYGTTICKWDVVIPFDLLWEQYERIIKDNGVILLFGTEPFSSKLRCSNLKIYKYDWIWYKSRAFNFFNAKKQPLKYHEIISVFYKKQPQYYPIMRKGEKNHRTKPITRKSNLLNNISKGEINTSDMKYPKSIIEIKSTDSTKNLHPTQKPVELLEYLIKTYTMENEIVLDNCMGSGSTGVACINTNRKFIGIEKDERYFEIAKERISKHI
jgi:site-specific DNA-methyltransferase (adenine-specific)